MTSKLKCPFCAYELQKNGLKNLCCPICGLVAPTKLWQALIHTKKQLDRAKQWLKEIVENHRYTPITTAEMALKELDNDE